MKKFSPFVICHLILMAVLFLAACFAMSMYAGGFKLAVEGRGLTEVLLSGFTLLLILVLLAIGMLYLFNEYSKRAAIYYKVFLVLLLCVTTIAILLDVCFTELNALLIGKNIFYGAKIIVLFVLAFWKNLGKKKTVTLAFMLLAFDILAAVLWLIHLASTGFDFNIMGAVSAIVADVTVLLAVKGKYADKAERGSK
ncbi:MAG: hypothetical protein IJP62_14225 [Treponema sp.]|nr:hypothetical protein [Treponema sp.]